MDINRITLVIIQRQGEGISGAQMHEILRELDVNSNGLVELDEYLQVNDSPLPFKILLDSLSFSL